VTYIGYGTQTQEITVSEGEPVTLNFELQISAVSLDEVVVTGTAGAVEKRKVGSSMTTMNMAQVQENVPVQDFGTALQARIPGVRSVGTVGGVGASRQLQIRGMASLRLDQRPVIYIDGVRVDAAQTEWGGMASAACCSFSGGAAEDRLSDLNPSEIERIEVLKGAAAATLYGSEATNGVIQIFTKRGRSNSPPQFSMNMSTGFNRLRENFQTTLYPEFRGPDGFQAHDSNDLIENGLISTVDLSAQGGGEDVTYFVSGGYSFEEGSLQPNNQKRANMRSNLRWVASDQWTFAINTAYSRNKILDLQSGNNWMSMLGNALLGNPRKATEEYPYGEPWLSVSDIKKVDTFDDTNRWTGGITATYTPTTWFSNKLTFGIDNVDEEKSRLLPYGYYYTYVGTVGERNLGYRRARNITADYLGTMSFGLTEGMDSELSFGAQGFWETNSEQMATGRGFAAPGVTTVGGAAITFGDESFRETVNIGLFAQDRLSYNDKLFATLGVRVDGNSSFGENYGLKTYPKFDLAYQISQEGFVPEFISSLKLRGAIGQAGKFPGAFDQFRTFSPTTVLDDLAGVSPSNPGNANLKPETTTEVEGGFDAGFFQDKVGLTFTYYYAKTVDALLGISLPPSEGFSSSRLENVGEIKNQGWEVSVNYTPVNTADGGSEPGREQERDPLPGRPGGLSPHQQVGRWGLAERRPGGGGLGPLPRRLLRGVPHPLRMGPGDRRLRRHQQHPHPVRLQLLPGAASAHLQRVPGEHLHLRFLPGLRPPVHAARVGVQQQRPSVPDAARGRGRVPRSLRLRQPGFQREPDAYFRVGLPAGLLHPGQRLRLPGQHPDPGGVGVLQRAPLLHEHARSEPHDPHPFGAEPALVGRLQLPGPRHELPGRGGAAIRVPCHASESEVPLLHTNRLRWVRGEA
jgi:TonB-dependent SusC/RagA subfamily outer membrane receptor